MFTGIVEVTGSVTQVIQRPPGVRLIIAAGVVASRTEDGESIAVNGCCLTVVSVEGDLLHFDAGEETLSRTNLGRLVTGSTVNLESSLCVGSSLAGHFVTGHIDAVGTLQSRRDDGDWSTCWFEMPPRLGSQMAGKGSIAVDGVSLTLVEVMSDRFSVALIPFTLQHTTLGILQPGDPVNLETDILAKYVERQVK